MTIPPPLLCVFQALASMATGLVLFALVAAASIVGSVIPAWSASLYGSWWFATLIGALVLNTGFCTLRQIPAALRGPLRVKVLFLVHTSVLVIALGCLWGTFAFQSTTVSVRVGETFVVAGESWTLEGVKVERYPDGTVSDWISIVQTPAGPQSIRVNFPAETGDAKVLQSGYARDYTVHIDAEGQSTTFELPQDTEAPLTANGLVGLALSPPRDGLLAAAQDDPEFTRTVDLLLLSQGKILQQTAAFEGVPLAIGDTGLTVTVVSSVPRSSFLIRETPGLWLVWAGLALLASSVTVLMLLPRHPKETPRA